jgi:hypothetical protein
MLLLLLLPACKGVSSNLSEAHKQTHDVGTGSSRLEDRHWQTNKVQRIGACMLVLLEHCLLAKLENIPGPHADSSIF